MNLDINLGIFDLVGVIMLVLASTSLIYLLRVKNKSGSTWMFFWFFLCVVMSSIATIITNIGTIWDWAFAPSQDAMLILGGVFLVRFAYLYPTSDQTREARWVVTFFIVLALVGLVYAVSFAIRYIANLPGDLAENQIYYLLLPVTLCFTVVVFFKRSLHWSNQTSSSNGIETKPNKTFFNSLLKPNNRPAAALRNYGLSLAISLIPIIVLIEKNALPAVVASFIFNFGGVIAIAALMLTYLNYTPEPTTLSAKLVGISMISVLLILGLAGVWVLHTNPGIDEHSLVLTFITLVLLSSLTIILIFPIFFRTALLDPLEKLLKGVKSANEGDLNTRVAVDYDDEIGYLTQSFNRMVRSIDDLTHELQNRALNLEAEVGERTIELVQMNVQLEKENEERQKVETRLNQQLLYQKALANCSQSLLATAENDGSQQEVLNQALEYLRSAAQASRAYLFQTFEDTEIGDYIGMLAEVCDTGIPAHIDNPVNQKFSLSDLEENLVSRLREGNPFGGPVKRIFASTPELQESFLSQTPPLLSVMLFPLFDREGWWGFIGFDDCITEREWDEMEISMLRTASEMISSTLQRWEIETRLRETLDILETRVQERTSELSQSNLKLNEEIGQRQLLQNDLEARLQIEEQLAIISARLLEPTKIRQNISASLQDLGRIMDADRIFMAEFDLQTTNQVREYYEWHQPGVPSASEQVAQSFVISLMALRDRLRQGETIYIPDTTHLPEESDFDLRLLQERTVKSFVLAPILIDGQVHAVLGCSNLQAPADTVQMNLRALELVASMLKSMLQREQLLQRLEEQVAERTRQLTTFLDMAMLSDQTQDLADILQPTLLAITQIAGCDAVGIHIINEEKSILALIAQRGIPLKHLESLREVRIDAEFGTWLAETEHHQTMDKSSRDILFPKPFCIAGYKAFIANRLRTGNKTLGLMSCYRVGDQQFSPFQETLLTALGELLGIIVENHRLRIEAEELAAVEERQRLAREIHDAVSQSVYSLSLFSRSAKDALDEHNQVKLLANLQDIEKTALQAMREMRLLLYQLREAGQEEDIAAALDLRFKQVENRLGIQATHEIKTELFLPANLRHELWRIIVEALNNTVKHANAEHVQVQLSCLDDNLRVTIQDDGTGFDSGSQFPGMGLKNMHTRAERLAGQLDIVSAPAQGTVIKLSIPTSCLYPGEEGVK
ncbi:MAG: GAF domain-containing protein [Anaerolineales bacterium]